MDTQKDQVANAEDSPRARSSGPWRRLWRGRPDDPAWVRPTLLALLSATALAYLWGLGDSGWANSFYSAAVQAASRSWTAFFFGSFDAANFITVDKPPAALWVMDLSARLFGVNAWSILVPQALEGVASVAILYATVRRWFSPGAGLLAGAIMALTPVAALMFRFNNPDALLVLLLTASAYALVRALERSETKWLLFAAALIGTGFLTKMLAAFLVVPAFVLVYLLAAETPFGRRVGQLILAAAVLVVSSGWWVAIVQLIPAADRPYVGGSQDNNLLNLIFGYNGFGRLTGNEVGSVGGGGQPGSMWGATGLLRLFQTDMGGQISWLIPAALILFAVVVVWTWRRSRTDRTRAQMLIWSGWLIVTGLVFSLAQGIIHPYYTVALAPALASMIAIGADFLWARRTSPKARLWLALAIAAAAVWSLALLARTPSWLPGLRIGIGVLAAAAVLFLVLDGRLPRRVALAGPLLGIIAALAGPAAYTMATVATPHSGAIPSAGPSVAAGFGPGGSFGGTGFGGRTGFRSRAAGTGSQHGFPGGVATGGQGGPPGGSGSFTPPSGTAFGKAPAGGFPRYWPRRGGAFAASGRGGGLLDASQPGAKLTALLKKNASHFTWVAATVGSNSAAGYQLATDDPIMAIGGFNGTDPAPTLDQFKQYVRDGRIHFFVPGQSFGGAGRGFGSFGSATQDVGSAITQWVEANFSRQTVDGQTIYDLTSPTR